MYVVYYELHFTKSYQKKKEFREELISLQAEMGDSLETLGLPGLNNPAACRDWIEKTWSDNANQKSFKFNSDSGQKLE